MDRSPLERISDPLVFAETEFGTVAQQTPAPLHSGRINDTRHGSCKSAKVRDKADPKDLCKPRSIVGNLGAGNWRQGIWREGCQYFLDTVRLREGETCDRSTA